MPGVAREELAENTVKTQLEWLSVISPKANQDIRKAGEGPSLMQTTVEGLPWAVRWPLCSQCRGRSHIVRGAAKRGKKKTGWKELPAGWRTAALNT